MKLSRVGYVTRGNMSEALIPRYRPHPHEALPPQCYHLRWSSKPFLAITNELNRRPYSDRRTRSQIMLISGVAALSFPTSVPLFTLDSTLCTSAPSRSDSLSSTPFRTPPRISTRKKSSFRPPTHRTSPRIHLYPLFLWCPNHHANQLTPRLHPPRYRICQFT